LLECQTDGRRARHHFGRQGDLHGQNVARVEPGIDPQEPPDALHHEPRAREQDHRQADFHGHEDALRAMASASGAARAFLQGFLRVRIRAVERRGQSEQDAGDDRDRQGEEQDVRVDPDFRGARQAARRGSQHQAGPPAGEQQADRGAPRDSRTLSVNNWRTTRQRSAPSAARMANSRFRAVERANSRLATLAQAMISTNPTAPTSSSSVDGCTAHHVVLHADQPRPVPRIGLGVLGGRGR
jgi:hypothetical protein